METREIEQFEQYRPLMFSIAYRMLGSITDAEDILQEAFLRYQGTARGEIVAPKAFLSTIVTRLCLNRLESAQMQRETYIGPWLPEPLLTEAATADVSERAELHESLSVAFLVLLEQLTPLERAVFLLRQVFDYEYDEIAEMVGKDKAACRQMLARTKKHVGENKPRFASDPEAHKTILKNFVAAVSEGDLDGLMQMLAEDVVLWADGGGKARGAVLVPLHGRDAVGRFISASPRLAIGPLEPLIGMVNGEPSLLLTSNGKTRLVITVGVENSKISAVRIMGNPDKLGGVAEPHPRAGGLI